tara:strand:- start:112 stop:582 length:471 start_codon:yes stop_codon:yes gene_type:complete
MGYIKRERSKSSTPAKKGNIKYDLMDPIPWDGDGDPDLARTIQLVAERYQTKDMAAKDPNSFGFKVAVYGFPGTGGWKGTGLKTCMGIFDAPFVMFDEALVPLMETVEEYLNEDPQKVWQAAHEAAIRAAELLKAAEASAPAPKAKRRQRTIVKST